MTPDTPADGEALYDDRTRPLLLQQAETRGAEDWRHEDAEAVIARLLAKIDSLSGALIPRPAEPAQAAQDEATALRRALAWAYDRLSADTIFLSEVDRTAVEIGNVLAGRQSPASEYDPPDYAQSPSRALIAAAQEGRE